MTPKKLIQPPIIVRIDDEMMPSDEDSFRTEMIVDPSRRTHDNVEGFFSLSTVAALGARSYGSRKSAESEFGWRQFSINNVDPGLLESWLCASVSLWQRAGQQQIANTNQT